MIPLHKQSSAPMHSPVERDHLESTVFELPSKRRQARPYIVIADFLSGLTGARRGQRQQHSKFCSHAWKYKGEC